MSNTYMDDDDDIICIEDSLHEPRENVLPTREKEKRIENSEEQFERFLVETITKANDNFSQILKPKISKACRAEEKELKEKEKNEKKIAREKLKELKEKEKLKRKIEREISSSSNTKAEQYIYCHVGSDICSTIDEFLPQVKMVFLDRKLENQLIVDNNIGDNIYWFRKCIELMEDEGEVKKFEYFSHQHVFGAFIEGKEFEKLVKAGKVEDFIASKKSVYALESADCLVLCYGQHGVSSRKMMELSLDVFEKTNAQFHFFKTSAELSLFLAQVIRSLSKKVHTESCADRDANVPVEKGIREGDRTKIIKDWWDKMLQCLWRSSDVQRLAILKYMPNPFVASQKYKKMSYTESLKELADIPCENDRRIGPALAHRLLMVLTDLTGKEIAE